MGEADSPIARLTPLGWTAVGPLAQLKVNASAHFAITSLFAGGVETPSWMDSSKVSFSRVGGSSIRREASVVSFPLEKEQPLKKTQTLDKVCVAETDGKEGILDGFSTWNRLLRVVARLLRWRHKTRGVLSREEVERAEERVIRLAQQDGDKEWG